MKKNIIFSILAILMLAISCEKDPDLRMPKMIPAVTPLITFTPTSDAYINSTDIGGYKAAIKVDVYFKTDKPKSMDLFVKYNKDDVALLKGDIKTFPTTVSFTMSDLIAALPSLTDISQITPGDNFSFGVNVTNEDGSVTKWNDSLYIDSSPDVNNYPGVTLVSTVDVLCPFDVNNYIGAYDFSDGDPADNCVVNVALDPADSKAFIISNVYAGLSGCSADGVIKIAFNPENYSISVPRQVGFMSNLFDYGPGNIGPGSGKLNTCNFAITFSADMDVEAGSFGSLAFTLTKK